MTNEEFLERENRKLRTLVNEILNERDDLLNRLDESNRLLSQADEKLMMR